MTMLMNMLSTWFRELFNRSLKCERVGHTEEPIRYRATFDSDSLFSVARRGTLTRHECARCGMALGEVSREYIYSIQSLQMPTSEYEEFRRLGYMLHEKVKL